MKVAVYPGSFNPWHAGHENVLAEALKVFDKVIVARGFNPEKSPLKDSFAFGPTFERMERPDIKSTGNWEFVEYSGLTTEFVKSVKASAIIKGLRNPKDFQNEQEQQYWNEDLGLVIPTFYVISDRKLVHISSSAIKLLERIKR